MGGKKKAPASPKAAPVKTFDTLSRAGQVFFGAAMNLSDEDERAFLSDLDKRDGKLDVSLTVNGVAFDFEAFANEVEQQFDRATEEAAEELLVRKATDLRQRLDALMARVEEETRAAVRAQFPGVRIDDE